MEFKDMSVDERVLDIRGWFEVPENYSIVHYAVERGISKQELLAAGEDSIEFGRALEYAFSVQEYKVVDGAINGKLDRTSALKMLETYNGWKSDVSIYQNISQSMSPELAERLSEAIEKMDRIGGELDESEPTDTFGEINVEVQ